MTRLGPKNQNLYKSALYLAVYIAELGTEPSPLRSTNYEAWAIQLHRQYERLRRARGPRAANNARLRGRALIADTGLRLAAAASLPGPRDGERVRCVACRKWTWPSLDAATVALTGLRKVPTIRLPDLLNVYRCPFKGWHIGHTYPWAGESLCIGEHK